MYQLHSYEYIQTMTVFWSTVVNLYLLVDSYYYYCKRYYKLAYLLQIYLTSDTTVYDPVTINNAKSRVSSFRLTK